MPVPVAFAAVLSRPVPSPAARRFCDELAARGLRVVLPDVSGSVRPRGFEAAQPAPAVVLNRVLGDEPGLAHLLDACELYERSLGAHVTLINATGAVRVAVSKRAQARRFAAAGIPHPATLLVGANSDAAVVGRELGWPVVLKPDHGICGEGLSLCADEPALRAALGELRDGAGVAQQFLPFASSTLRLLMAGGRLIAAGRRVAAPGDWKANVAQGAAMHAHTPSGREVALAGEMMSACGLDLAGVDLVTGPAGVMALEVNPSPGMAGIERAAGWNVTARALDALLGR